MNVFIEKIKNFPIAVDYSVEILQDLYNKVLEDPFLCIKSETESIFTIYKKIILSPLTPYVEYNRYYEIDDYYKVEYLFLKDNLKEIIEIFDSYYYEVIFISTIVSKLPVLRYDSELF